MGWIMEEGMADSRKMAVKIGENFRRNGAFDHVNNDHEFKDGPLFYRFSEENSSQDTDTPFLDLKPGSIPELLTYLNLGIYIEPFKQAGYNDLQEIRDMHNELHTNFQELINKINCIL